MSKLRYGLIVVILLVSISLVITGCIGNSTSLTSRYLCVDEGNGSELSTQELVAEVAPVVVSMSLKRWATTDFGGQSLTARLFKCHNFVIFPPSIL